MSIAILWKNMVDSSYSVWRFVRNRTYTSHITYFIRTFIAFYVFPNFFHKTWFKETQKSLAYGRN